MIRQLIFPNKAPWAKPNEYGHHYQFIRKYALLNGIEVVMSNGSPTVYCSKSTYFSVEIDGRQAIFDYSDHEPLSAPDRGIPYFKFHYHKDVHGSHPMVFPIGPMLDLPSPEGYRRFFQLMEENIYQCKHNTIINSQRPRLNARQRRIMVQQMLRRAYGPDADTSFIPNGQAQFWEKHRRCLLAVCVPGARNNMLDRGHYEQLALGICTVSPFIRTTLPGNRELAPGVHYLACKDDYSDLLQIIEWSRANRKQCREIGRRAQELFRAHCRPGPFWHWIEKCLAKNQVLT